MPSRPLIGLATVVILAVVVAAIGLPHSPAGLRELLLGLGPAAPAIAVAAWVALTPSMFPGTVLAAAGGLAFGALGGAAVALVGAVAGGMAAFALARTVARAPVDGFVRRNARLARASALLERRGFAVVLAARLMPGVPATGLHYAAAVSRVRAGAFAGAIAIGALLRTVPYALLGDGLGSGSLLTTFVAAGSIVVSGLAAAVLIRHIRGPAVASA
jgi:uncharacterized membrane protein YdjX (TVP38/TMEM64 family)